MNEDKELETLEQKAAAEAAAESIRRIESGLGCYAFGCFPKSFFEILVLKRSVWMWWGRI